MPVTTYIALGSNLGERRDNLNQALALLAQTPGITVGQVSSFHETDPVGGPAGQGKYLNAAAELHTTLSPAELLARLLEVEQQLGRVRLEKDGPRTLDLDLLLYGQQVVSPAPGGPDLEVPHPRLHERRFVLTPLAEIAADMVHPVFKRTVAELLREVEARDKPILRDLAGRRAMVTGSTSGIGRAIALELAAAGADVIVHGRRSLQQAKEVTAECQKAGVRSETLLTDLGDESALEEFAARAWDLWGGLDIWINNAGADTLTGAAAGWTFEQKLDILWQVDVRATMLLSRSVGARMKRLGRGVILNMGWDQAETGMEGDSGQLFAASKGAVVAFSRSLALTLAPQVRVNCLAPGWIRTAWGRQASQAWQTRAQTEAPLGRWGTPEDVARTAHWLVSDAADFITGQIIRVNGGAVRG